MSSEQIDNAPEPEGRAATIHIVWTDGLEHRWIYKIDGTWDLTLTSPGFGSQVITGYKREDMERVLGTALKHTTTEEGADRG
jgi:hypothetical protein